MALKAEAGFAEWQKRQEKKIEKAKRSNAFWSGIVIGACGGFLASAFVFMSFV